MKYGKVKHGIYFLPGIDDDLLEYVKTIPNYSAWAKDQLRRQMRIKDIDPALMRTVERMLAKGRWLRAEEGPDK